MTFNILIRFYVDPRARNVALLTFKTVLVVLFVNRCVWQSSIVSYRKRLNNKSTHSGKISQNSYQHQNRSCSFFMHNFAWLQINVLRICFAHPYGVTKMCNSLLQVIRWWCWIFRKLSSFSVLRSYAKNLYF